MSDEILVDWEWTVDTLKPSTWIISTKKGSLRHWPGKRQLWVNLLLAAETPAEKLYDPELWEIPNTLIPLSWSTRSEISASFWSENLMSWFKWKWQSVKWRSGFIWCVYSCSSFTYLVSNDFSWTWESWSEWSPESRCKKTINTLTDVLLGNNSHTWLLNDLH